MVRRCSTLALTKPSFSKKKKKKQQICINHACEGIGNGRQSVGQAEGVHKY
jgi:hypothetical protein